MADDKRKTAIDVIARHTIAMAAIAESAELSAAEIVRDDDREAVAAAIVAAANSMDPGTNAFDAACEYLAGRDGVS